MNKQYALAFLNWAIHIFPDISTCLNNPKRARRAFIGLKRIKNAVILSDDDVTVSEDICYVGTWEKYGC